MSVTWNDSTLAEALSVEENALANHNLYSYKPEQLISIFVTDKKLIKSVPTDIIPTVKHTTELNCKDKRMCPII